MRVELPPGYVPPEPTHPSYGYLTPEERVRQGIVPGVEEATEAVEEPVTAGSSPPPPIVEMSLEVEEATVAHTGWVPEPPPDEQVPAPATLGEFRWDARAQQCVTDPP